MNCNICKREAADKKAVYEFDIEANPDVTIIYRYLCFRHWSMHTEVGRKRYKRIEERS